MPFHSQQKGTARPAASEGGVENNQSTAGALPANAVAAAWCDAVTGFNSTQTY